MYDTIYKIYIADYHNKASHFFVESLLKFIALMS